MSDEQEQVHTFTVRVRARRGLSAGAVVQVQQMLTGYVAELTKLEPSLAGARVTSAAVDHHAEDEAPTPPKKKASPTKKK